MARERTTRSLLALETLLQAVITSPDGYRENDRLVAALNSQGALAKFQDKELGIYATSLNTHKRISAEHIAGGFKSFDALRISALGSIEKSRTVPSTDSNKRKEKQERASELKAVNLKLNQQFMRLAALFFKSLSITQSYANESKNPAIKERFLVERTELLTMFYDHKGDVLSLESQTKAVCAHLRQFSNCGIYQQRE